MRFSFKLTPEDTGLVCATMRDILEQCRSIVLPNTRVNGHYFENDFHQKLDTMHASTQKVERVLYNYCIQQQGGQRLKNTSEDLEEHIETSVGDGRQNKRIKISAS